VRRFSRTTDSESNLRSSICARVAHRQTFPDSDWTFPDSAIYAACVRSSKQKRSQRSSALHPEGREAMVRIGTTLGLLKVLRNMGEDPIRLLAEAGADLALFDNPENWVSYAERNHWVAHCVERTGCRHLGLLSGQLNDLHSLGLVGLLVKYSPDVESALRSLVRYFHLHVRGAVTTLHVEGRSAMFGFETYVSGAEANDQIEDAALAASFNILRALCGPEWNATEVRFAHRKPENVRPFREFFRAPLLFDDEKNAVVFHSSWMRHRLPEDDPDVRQLLEKQVEALEVKFGDEFPEQVRAVLRTALLTDHGNADQIASLFSMHSRTLHRRLTAMGTSFRELVDQIRFEIARQMLADTDADVSHVANVLDYADSSAFTRAFRRWSGTTPAQWRVQQKRKRTAR
jgi:AraC-like DNA-binding protein